MEHVALYRKWRPQNFHTILGQDDNVRVLKNAVIQGRTVHAYLFCGTRGTGKTSTARILAKALNCEHPVDGEPCNECDACRGITEGSFLDVIEIDAASNRGIDEVRDLLEKVHFVPVKGKYKVYIIDEAHMLTTEAFNALLKTFEEPPAHVVFILATTEARKIPLTIVSRCQRYDFKSIDDETLIGALTRIAEAEHVPADEEAIALLAEKARGSMRDALSLMDQAMGSAEIMTAEEIDRLTGSVSYQFWPGFFKAIAEGDLPAVFTAIDEVEREGKDLRQFFRDFRDRAGDLISAGEMKSGGRAQRALKACAAYFTPEQILEIITVCGESEIVFRYNRDGKAVCRFLMARIMKELSPKTPAAPAADVPGGTEKRTKPAPARIPAEKEMTQGEPDLTAEAAPLPEEPPMEDVPPPTEEISPVPVEEPALEPAPAVIPDLFPARPGKDETEKTAEDAVTPERKEAAAAEVPAKSEGAKTSAAEKNALWTKLLRTLRQADMATYTWLNIGELAEISDDAIVVTYPESDRLFLSKIKEPDHANAVEKALQELFGRAMTFKARLADENNTSELSLF
ncbi:MAG: DNA polymerase III subunit gamma/tau [Bacillota bacterium]|jgi:DNA polymerase-3 subunit gamma/tau